MAQRNITIDIARGIAIILVVVGHSGIESHITNGIYFFHMPLFFFISGIFLKPKNSLREITKGLGKILRIQKLYLPFVVNMLILLTLSPFLHKYLLTSTYITSFSEWVKNAIIILRFRVGCVELLGHYWFLPVLFFTNLLSIIITYRIRQKTWIIIISFFLFITGYTLYVNYNIKTPYDFSRIMYYTGFYLAGYCCADKLSKINSISLPKASSIIAFLLIFIIILTQYAEIIFNNAFFYLSTSILGIVLIFNISAILRNNIVSKIISYIGRHTMIIFTWHIVVFKIVEYTLAQYNIINMSEGWSGSYYTNSWWWLYTISGIIIPTIIYLLIKQIQFFYGYNH